MVKEQISALLSIVASKLHTLTVSFPQKCVHLLRYLRQELLRVGQEQLLSAHAQHCPGCGLGQGKTPSSGHVKEYLFL